MRTTKILLVIATAFVLSTMAAQVPNTIRLSDGEHEITCDNGQQIEYSPIGINLLTNCPPLPTPTPTPNVPTRFVETFDGDFDSPTSWQPQNWSKVIHSRDINTWVQPEPMNAGHGSSCSPYPATHVMNSYADAVFICRNHAMTSLRASGYGVIYLTPNHLVDFSNGEAVIRFDVSTLRTSHRDWIDLWVTPYNDNLVAPLEDWLPDLNGEPRNSIHIRMRFGTAGNLSGVFEGYVIRDFQSTAILPQRTNASYATVLTPSAIIRQTFELRISTTHIKFGMPTFDLWWIDNNIAPLAWNQGIVQIGHHSYNPTKDCLACSPNTWHWDSVSIEPAIPFTIINANRRSVDLTNPILVAFPQAAPSDSYLRFSGIGNNIEVSFDGGATWQLATMQSQEEFHTDHFRSYWMPIPAGVDSALFRGQNWYSNRGHARDISIWSKGVE